MAQVASGKHNAPDVDASETLKVRTLEAQLFSLDAQLRRADVRRTTEASREGLLARREELAAELQPLTAPPPDERKGAQTTVTRIDESLIRRSVAAAVFNPVHGTFGLGTSGVVQVGPASSGVDIVAHGKYPSSGEIVPVPGSPPGEVAFTGHLEVNPHEGELDPEPDYFWLRNWSYLIPFPPPAALSRFTYRFDADALLNIYREHDEAVAMCFVSIGETPDLETGVSVPVNVPMGWMVQADLTQTTATYNGSWGSFAGRVTVQRSFEVGSRNVPGVAVVVGVIAGLNVFATINLENLLQASTIIIGSSGTIGRVEYSYEPILVAEP